MMGARRYMILPQVLSRWRLLEPTPAAAGRGKHCRNGRHLRKKKVTCPREKAVRSLRLTNPQSHSESTESEPDRVWSSS